MLILLMFLGTDGLGIGGNRDHTVIRCDACDVGKRTMSAIVCVLTRRQSVTCHRRGRTAESQEEPSEIA